MIVTGWDQTHDCDCLRSNTWLWLVEIKHMIVIGWDQTHDCNWLRSNTWLWLVEIKHMVVIGWDQTHDCDWLRSNTVVNHGTQTQNLFPVGNYMFKVNFEQVNAGWVDPLRKLIVLIDIFRFPFRNEERKWSNTLKQFVDNLQFAKWNFWVLQNCLRLLRFDWSDYLDLIGQITQIWLVNWWSCAKIIYKFTSLY